MVTARKARWAMTARGSEVSVGRGRNAGRLIGLVVTHDRLEKLKKSVSRLLAESDEHLAALVVVDNVSTDGTAEWLAQIDDPRLVVWRNPSNLGGAGGFEAGIRLAMEKLEPDWIVVMDDDAHPMPGALAAFHAEQRPDDTAVAAAVFLPDGRISEMNRPSVNPFWNPGTMLATLARAVTGKRRDGYHIPFSAYEGDAPRDIDLTSFVGLFLSRRMIAQTGLPDGKLFLYGDDVIYTLRLRRQGFAISFDPKLRFEHDCSTFENDQKRVFRPLWKVYYTYRNGLIMYHAAAGILFWLLLPVAVTKWALVAGRYGADRARYRRLMWRAVWDAVRGRTNLSHEEVMQLAAGQVNR